MEKWKFLLLGVTGDLASKKILPGISQFAQLNDENVKISLIGYSRSKPNEEVILKILNDNSTTGKHFLSSVSFLQGQYDDADFFGNFISSLDEDETGVIYMAVPPNVFVDFLKTSCPYSNKKIHILVEKPFGRDLLEAQKILNLVKECTLQDKVHFTDHYYFKTQTILEKADHLNLKSLKNKQITKIEVQALEKLGVEERAGYFETIGSLKDMLPHILTLVSLAVGIQKNPNNENFFKGFNLSNIEWGQYKSYIKDVQNPSSITETYFKVDGKTDSKIKLIFESGKNLGLKKTQIKVNYNDETELIWRIEPEKNIELISADHQLTLNLNRNSKLDHTNIFEMILEGDFSNFVKHDDILLSWFIYQTIVNYKNTKFVKPFIYKDNHYPIQKVVSKKQ